METDMKTFGRLMCVWNAVRLSGLCDKYPYVYSGHVRSYRIAV
jgi:hypothetical protein